MFNRITSIWNPAIFENYSSPLGELIGNALQVHDIIIWIKFFLKGIKVISTLNMIFCLSHI
jgi:hypothetical protein